MPHSEAMAATSMSNAKSSVKSALWIATTLLEAQFSPLVIPKWLHSYRVLIRSLSVVLARLWVALFQPKRESWTSAFSRQISVPWTTKQISRRTKRWKNSAVFWSPFSSKLLFLNSTLAARLISRFLFFRLTVAIVRQLSMQSVSHWWTLELPWKIS